MCFLCHYILYYVLICEPAVETLDINITYAEYFFIAVFSKLLGSPIKSKWGKYSLHLGILNRWYIKINYFQALALHFDVLEFQDVGYENKDSFFYDSEAIKTEITTKQLFITLNLFDISIHIDSAQLLLAEIWKPKLKCSNKIWQEALFAGWSNVGSHSRNHAIQ